MNSYSFPTVDCAAGEFMAQDLIGEDDKDPIVAQVTESSSGAKRKPAASNKKMKPNHITTLQRLAAILGCGFSLITLGTASAQQSLRPTLILHVGAPQEVNAQPNFVMAQPHAPIEMPFRSTMGDAAYAAAKQRANSAYASGITKPLPLAPTTLAPRVITSTNFNGHSETEGFFPPRHKWRDWHQSFCRGDQ